MIGNDIVDLAFASSGKHWKSQRFLDKIFSCEEQNAIINAGNPFCTMWLLWSMKESAFKIHARYHDGAAFSPIKTSCQLNSETEGLVLLGNDLYRTSSLITVEYIYTTAQTQSSGKLMSACGKLKKSDYATQHCESYSGALNSFAELLNCDIESLEIRKNESGVPSMYKKDVGQSIHLSITHHGHYYGYAVPLE